MPDNRQGQREAQHFSGLRIRFRALCFQSPAQRINSRCLQKYPYGLYQRRHNNTNNNQKQKNKMKKTIMFFVCCLMAAMGASAQDLPTTVLKSSKGIKVFYGVKSLVEAVDSIKAWGQDDSPCSLTLSSGVFEAPSDFDVSNMPNILIRGAGMDSGTGTTVQSDNTTLKSSAKLDVEGIYFRTTFSANPVKKTFTRCRFKKYTSSGEAGDTYLNDNIFIQCRMEDWAVNNESKFTAFNSIFMDCGQGNSWQAEFNNCLISYPDRYVRMLNDVGGMTNMYNCIFVSDYYLASDFDSRVALNNCLVLHRGNNDTLGNQTSSTNISLPYDSISTVFKSYTGTYTTEETFELTDEAKAKYLGADGRQVGIYGGDYSYDPSVSYPHITKKTVAARTENGKLKVNVEISVGNK